ncbi:MAG: class I SAM-dependent methyltransferase [Myxococcota bacterium]
MKGALCQTRSPKLSPRLLALLGLVPWESRVADVGCDHALLLIRALISGRVSFGVGVDASEQALRGARDSRARWGLEDRLVLRHGRGLASLTQNEVDVVVMAGMGACNVLESLWVAEHLPSRLVLQPNRDLMDLRRALADLGWRIDKECLPGSGRRFHPTLSLVPGEQPSMSELELFLGPELMKQPGPELLAWADRAILPFRARREPWVQDYEDWRLSALRHG